MMSVRTLPIRLTPVEGEALDSWLEALAHRSDAAWADILAAVGLLPGRFGTFPWIVDVPAAQAASISAATGIALNAVHAMTFAHFDKTPLRANAQYPSVSRPFPWARASGSRYCPQCLADSGGRWQLMWRLGWSFACVKHACLLADVCPKCLGVQRVRAAPTRHTTIPGRCVRPSAYGNNRSHARCGGELAWAATPQLGRAHPILEAQQTVYDIIRSGVDARAHHRGVPQPSVHALADIRCAAAHILATEKRTTIDKTVGLDQLDVSYHARHAVVKPARRTSWNAEQWACTPHASIAAVGISAAVLTMRSSRAGAAKVTTARYRAARPEAETVALGNAIRPSDELRYRTTSVETTSRGTQSRRVENLARRTPTMLWPAWSLRFALPHCTQSQLRPALSALLLLVDTDLRLTDAVALLNSPMDRTSLSRILQLLSNRTDWPQTRAALGRLADYLAAHDTPINFQRRRQLDYATLLPDPIWAGIARTTCPTAPGPARARLTRLYLYERLSGQPAPRAALGPVQSELCFNLANYPLRLTAELTNALAEHARIFLADNGIDDEPPFWDPPTDILAGLALPGPDPDAVNADDLHRLVQEANLSGKQIARRLNTTLPIVRHVNESDPPKATLPAAGSSGRAKRLLTPRDLNTLYWEDQLTLREIAVRVGVDRVTISNLAREYGMALRSPRTPLRRNVDAEWLYEQYVVQRRTFPEIARLCGSSTTTVARWAKLDGLAVRGRGGPSHRANLDEQIAADNAPQLLRPALAGVGGWERLGRFVIATQFPTMTVAARHLGAPGLVLQIERIEAELGFLLFVRAERGRAMQLTDEGRQVLDAIRSMQRATTRPS